MGGNISQYLPEIFNKFDVDKKKDKYIECVKKFPVDFPCIWYNKGLSHIVIIKILDELIDNNLYIRGQTRENYIAIRDNFEQYYRYKVNVKLDAYLETQKSVIDSIFSNDENENEHTGGRKKRYNRSISTILKRKSKRFKNRKSRINTRRIRPRRS
jgi:hypothetical protein